MLSKISRLFALTCLLSLLSPTRVGAYHFLYPLTLWPTDQNIPMVLQLGTTGSGFIDGSSSWNAVAEGALAYWNDYMNTVQFTVYRQNPGPHVDGDRQNQVFFGTTVYGQSFGRGVLAVTTRWNDGSKRTEGDTVFNDYLSWNSYRGNQLPAAGSGTLYDLRRVALHEFGHTLGLDHPDDWGQNVYAVMNSTIGNLDGLTLDDVNGAEALYFRLAPTISGQPQSQTIPAGSSATFSVGASGIPSPTYQWYWKGQILPSGTSASITVSTLQYDWTGEFQVVVSNSRGSVTSSSAFLVVLYPPHMTSQPQSKTVAVGQSANFSVSASGVPAPSFQWYLNGNPISGAASSTLTIPFVQNSDAGDYTVSAINSQGSDPSQIATLQVLPVPLAVVIRPATQIAFVGTNLFFDSELISVGSYSCQWFFNGRKLPGRTTPTLYLPTIVLGSRGDYQLEVRNASGVIRSDPAHVDVAIPPTILTQPRPTTARLGKPAVLRVAAKGSLPLTYQWFKDGVAIPGATFRVFKIFYTQPGDAGAYFARVSNIGAIRDSVPIQLTVIP